MASLCETHLIGHVGSDAEVREVGARYILSYPLACSRSWKKPSGEWENRTVWLKVNQWFVEGPVARNAAARIKKGAQVYVRGRLEEPEVWLDKATGKPRSRLVVTALEFALVLGKQDRGDDGGEASAPLDHVTDEDLPF